MQTPEEYIAELLTDSPADRPKRVAARDAEIAEEARRASGEAIPTPARSDMAAKMLGILVTQHGRLIGTDAEVADTMHRLIAAVFDNLPREAVVAMGDAYAIAIMDGLGEEGAHKAAIAAARRVVLGHAPAQILEYNPAWSEGEIGDDEKARMEASGWRMRPDGSYFKAGS